MSFSRKISGADIIDSCMTTDVVTLYSFNKSWDFLDHEDFNPRWHRMIKANGDVHLIKHFPFILPLVQSLPDPIIRVMDYLLNSDLMLIMDWQKVIPLVFFVSALLTFSGHEA
jgi:hypothetical protein